jgi:hypothetical protein
VKVGPALADVKEGSLVSRGSLRGGNGSCADSPDLLWLRRQSLWPVRGRSGARGRLSAPGREAAARRRWPAGRGACRRASRHGLHKRHKRKRGSSGGSHVTAEQSSDYRVRQRACSVLPGRLRRESALPVAQALICASILHDALAHGGPFGWAIVQFPATSCFARR